MNAMAGLILAGGKSSRMGRDKALLDYQGQPLVKFQIQKLKEVGCQPIAISGPSGRGYELFTDQVIKDLTPDLGPLGGIYSALKEMGGVESVLVLGVDMPKVTTEFLSRLIDSSEGYDSTFPVSKEGIEPLCAIYQAKVCLAVIEEQMARSQLSLKEFIKEISRKGRTLAIEQNEWSQFGNDLFLNWNTPEDF